MIDWDALAKQVEKMSVAITAMRRTTALMKMSMPDHPARPLIRVMVKLDIIKNWPI